MMGGEGSQRRGQSEVLGVVLLFGIVLSMSVLVVVAGGAVMDASQDSVSAEGAAVSMSELDGQVSSMDARTDGSAAATFEGFAGDGDVSVRQDSNMRIVVAEEDGTEVVDRNVTLGAVVYERGDEELAYEAGGVWRKNRGSDASRSVSPPQFEYRYDAGDPTLTLPLVTVAGDATGDDISLRQTSPSETVLPDHSTAVNPLDDGERVELTVHSEYYRAWGEFFSERTDGQVSYDHADQNVTLELTGLQSPTPNNGSGVDGAVSTSDLPVLNYDNSALTGSYDSSGPPWQFDRDEGDVYVKGAFDPTETDSSVHGDLYVRNASDMSTNNRDSPRVVKGDAVFGDAGVGQTVVDGNYRIHGKLSIQGPAEVYGRASSRNVTVDRHLLVGGDLDRFDHADVGGDVRVDGNLGPVGVDDADVNDVAVDGGTYVSGSSASVTGATTGGEVLIGGDLEGLSNSRIGGPLHVNGEVDEVSDSTIEGEARIDGDVERFDNVTVEGPLHVGGDLEDVGPATVDGDVTVDGRLDFDEPSISPGDPFVVNGTLYVNEELSNYERRSVDVEEKIVVDCDWLCLFGPSPGPDEGPDWPWEDDDDRGPSFTQIEDRDEDDIPDAASPTSPDLDAMAGPEDPTFEPMTAMDDEIDSVERELRDPAVNTNDKHPDVIDRFPTGGDECDSTCTLTSGRYYVDDEIDLSDETLVLDATEGPIELYTDGLRIADGNLTVRGDNRVSVYNGEDFELVETSATGDAKVVTRPVPYQADNFWLHMRSDATADLNNDAGEFTGVLNGPGDPDGTSITLTNGYTVYGAVVGEVSEINENASIYYDESLGSGSGGGGPIQPSGSQVRFVHVTTKTVEVSD